MTTTVSGDMFRKFAGTQGQQTAGKSTGNYTSNDNQSNNRYDDFTTKQRWKTWGLNILPGGLGSFLIMKDNVGGGILVGANIVAIGLITLASGQTRDSKGFVNNESVGDKLFGGFDEEMSINVAYVSILGAGLFNAIRSYTYHKPNNVDADVNNFKPYDGLKLSILPTSSGAYKVYARYDYTF